MNLNLNGKRVVITGGSQGLGLAMVQALAACGANVTAIARDRAKLGAAEQAGAAVINGDATDATLMNRVVKEEAPDVVTQLANNGLSGPVSSMAEPRCSYTIARSRSRHPHILLPWVSMAIASSRSTTSCLPVMQWRASTSPP
jgi:NAD(P)-dependent dehydrogenase (short-subunit alcohol dehydrogenase family)